MPCLLLKDSVYTRSKYRKTVTPAPRTDLWRNSIRPADSMLHRDWVPDHPISPK